MGSAADLCKNGAGIAGRDLKGLGKLNRDFSRRFIADRLLLY